MIIITAYWKADIWLLPISVLPPSSFSYSPSSSSYSSYSIHLIATAAESFCNDDSNVYVDQENNKVLSSTRTSIAYISIDFPSNISFDIRYSLFFHLSSFYSILFYSILFYSILFYSVLYSSYRFRFASLKYSTGMELTLVPQKQSSCKQSATLQTNPSNPKYFRCCPIMRKI